MRSTPGEGLPDHETPGELCIPDVEQLFAVHMGKHVLGADPEQMLKGINAMAPGHEHCFRWQWEHIEEFKDVLRDLPGDAHDAHQAAIDQLHAELTKGK